MEAVKRQGDFSRTDEAMARATAYLRCAGLPADCAEREAAAALERAAAVRMATDKSVPSTEVDKNVGPTEENLVAAVLIDVICQFDAWLKYLADESGTAGRQPGLLAWHVALLLAQYPEAFLKRDDLPPAFLVAVRASGQPSMPDEIPAAMPAQPLAQFPAIFRGHFWQRLSQRFLSAARWVGAWKGEG